ncbi:MAG TPA: amino acid adenylation domain-containing protein [Chthoniobacterales bacterium]|nr:amino acid adenylation domain-containing protein [Chthoniobacterales bacterium]
MLAERAQPLRDWHGTEAPWPSTACVHQLFEQQVERTPDAPALRFGEETLSYRELNFRANALANLLRAQGLGADAVVGICVERSFDMVASVLAVLKAGAAYLPLDPAYPHERLQFMLEDSRAAILLTQTELRHVFPNCNTPALFLDEDWPRGAHPSGENPENITTPASLSYLIYTSGSTGKPKGVAMVHRALVNLIDWQLKDSRLNAAAKTLQFTSLSFDVSFQEIFSTLCLGGTLVLIPADLRLNPPELWNFIVREKIARIFLPFVALQQLADAAAAEGTTAEALREVVTAGEQLQVTPRLREMFARHPEATLHNHYGPSETHVVTALTLSGDPQQWPALPSIGRPIQNTQIYLLDENGKPAPPGVPGELCIGGVALARGYFERPDITAERFVRDPFSEDAGARLYKTGDLARWLLNGEIEFLGRIDQQVKIRGYRIELGEIEAALNKLPAVRESVVIARERLPGQKELVAYLIAHQTGIVDTVQLRQELKQHLPDQMVPSSFVFLEKFPLTSSGKVDRKSLPMPGLRIVAAAPAPPSERPWLPIQFQLVQIWEEILGVKPVGIRDNFFELGGHSLLAVKMMDRVREITGRQLPVTALFKEATITHLAELILGEEQNALLPMIELQARGARLPFYFLHGDVIGGGFYVRDLSRLLGDNQPFYVLPPVEIPEGALPSVEVMATQHLKDLRAHRPNGPYLLGGFCIGGLIAYEMAQRLSAVGEEVSFVALIDPELPGAFLRGHLRLVRWLTKTRSLAPRQTTRLFSRGHKFLYRLREEWNAPFRNKVRFAAAKVRALFGGNGDDLALSMPAGSVENFDHDEDVLATFQWILSSYAPPRYDGPVTIFVTEEQESFAPFLRRKWQKAAPQAEVHGLAGGHLGSITTNVEVLAGKLDERLKRISASPGQIVGFATLWNAAWMA